ncbi:E3 ubiquitin-protein ligase COP1 isoform X2 [Coffea arabica]|uniref:E3 ubiquitin-protein ligase COP1 isoform X2 n=1 Tax=Coffea arabica TaxID=13443 RepID=A0A6P6UDK6_COFAR|nr:E3 ubiquitin-protein ligase COP1-like isoform X3 [Coffea arabica]
MGGESSSIGALVPTVKSELGSNNNAAAGEREQEQQQPEAMAVEEELAMPDRDILCPICMQLIKDAFLTSCGHSFCYMCIVTHLQNKSDCPCCSHFLTPNHLYPNFLLNKLLMKASACQIAKTATPAEQLHKALQQGYEVSVKELDSLLSFLAEKKRTLEQQEAETNMQIMLDFLHCLRNQKLGELNESQCHMGSSTSHNWKADEKTPSGSQIIQIKDANSDLDSQQLTQSGLLVARKKRVHAQFNDLQDCYMQRRRSSTRQSQKKDERDRREGYSTGLEDFQTVLSTFTRYSRLRVVAELRHGDLFHSANIVSSIEFDRDDELFATAGVSRRIKVFEFSSVVNEPADVPCPIAEMSTRSKLSCLSWNKYTKNHIASSDYEGIVTVWDVTTHQSVMEYEEHEKRAWSVDFSRTEPSMLVSGSDDCKVKIWCTNQEASVLNIDMKANICSVKYNPGSSIHIVVGSADHHIHYYDLRNTSQPVHIFSGHRKAVSYVKFLSNSELASASTDSTLRLWDVKENIPLRTFRGHTNEKNFVGLTVNSEYIACGSETNEVFVYHKAISKPAAWHKFGSDVQDADEDAGSYFISAVCWKSDSPTMLTANSQGTIKVLLLAE